MWRAVERGDEPEKRGGSRPHRRWDASQKPLVAVSVAIAAVLLTTGTDWVDAWRSHPKLDASLRLSDGEVVLGIKAKAPVRSISVDIPILGRVVSIHDYNSAADVVVATKAVTGYNLRESQNNVELVMTDMAANLTCPPSLVQSL